MFLVILIIVLINFLTSTGWLHLLNKIFKPTYDLLHFIVPLTITTSLLLVLVPIWCPSITFGWLVGFFFYLVIGAVICGIPDKE